MKKSPCQHTRKHLPFLLGTKSREDQLWQVCWLMNIISFLFIKYFRFILMQICSLKEVNIVFSNVSTNVSFAPGIIHLFLFHDIVKFINKIIIKCNTNQKLFKINCKFCVFLITYEYTSYHYLLTASIFEHIEILF